MLRWSDNGYALNQNLEMTITETTQQLLALREHRSVRQLANEIGTSAEMVRRWLRGEAQPRVDTAETIREMFSETLGNHDFSVSKTKPKHHGRDDSITDTTQQLRALRKHRSVRQLANEIGTSAEVVRRWLRGEAQPRADKAENISDVLFEIETLGNHDFSVSKTKPKHHGGDDHIYEKLQALKEGSSVQVVAEKMGKHPEMIRRWLRRESKPRGESAKNINDMFSEIFGDYDSFVKRTKMLGNSKS